LLCHEIASWRSTEIGVNHLRADSSATLGHIGIGATGTQFASETGRTPGNGGFADRGPVGARVPGDGPGGKGGVGPTNGLGRVGIKRKTEYYHILTQGKQAMPFASHTGKTNLFQGDAGSAPSGLNPA